MVDFQIRKDGRIVVFCGGGGGGQGLSKALLHPRSTLRKERIKSKRYIASNPLKLIGLTINEIR